MLARIHEDKHGDKLFIRKMTGYFVLPKLVYSEDRLFANWLDKSLNLQRHCLRNRKKINQLPCPENCQEKDEVTLMASQSRRTTDPLEFPLLLPLGKPTGDLEP